MNLSSETATRYDRNSIVLHWLTAVLVAALWLLGQTIDDFASGSPRVYARSVHISLGALLVVVAGVRAWWRLSHGARLPPAGTGWRAHAATWGHAGLYLLLTATLVLGLANAWERGDNLFNLWRIAAFDAQNKALRQTLEDGHALSANVLLAVVGGHAALALVHRYVLKDDVLQRMLPWR